MLYNKTIYEYDIKQCDANVMLDYNLIDRERYNELVSMIKERRVITVGIMRKDSDLDRKYHEAIKDSVDAFIKTNELSEEDVYEIAKDAIWTHRKCLNRFYKDNIEFVCKNEATSMYVFKNVRFYYNNYDGSFFTRGIGKRQPSILKFVKYMMSLIESTEKRRYEIAHAFKTVYLQKKAPKEYYEPLYGDNDNLNLEIIDDIISCMIVIK